jgi:hypothetical protein
MSRERALAGTVAAGYDGFSPGSADIVTSDWIVLPSSLSVSASVASDRHPFTVSGHGHGHGHRQRAGAVGGLEQHAG